MSNSLYPATTGQTENGYQASQPHVSSQLKGVPPLIPALYEKIRQREFIDLNDLLLASIYGFDTT